MTPEQLAKKAIEIAKRNPEVRKAVIAACRSATLIEDFAIEPETQKLLFERLRANDIVQLVYSVAPGLPDRKVQHRVLLDYNPVGRDVLLGAKDSDSKSIKDSQISIVDEGDYLVYQIGNLKGFRILKLEKEPTIPLGGRTARSMGRS